MGFRLSKIYTRTDDNISVTLKALEKNYAEVEVNNSAALAPDVSDTPSIHFGLAARERITRFSSSLRVRIFGNFSPTLQRWAMISLRIASTAVSASVVLVRARMAQFHQVIR